MKILAIETSSDACSVALDIDSEVLGEQRIAPQQTVQLLLPMIDQLMAKCGISANALDGVAFGAGPGSFTGLRIAAATVSCNISKMFGHTQSTLPVWQECKWLTQVLNQPMKHCQYIYAIKLL